MIPVVISDWWSTLPYWMLPVGASLGWIAVFVSILWAIDAPAREQAKRTQAWIDSPETVGVYPPSKITGGM